MKFNFKRDDMILCFGRKYIVASITKKWQIPILYKDCNFQAIVTDHLFLKYKIYNSGIFSVLRVDYEISKA